MAHPLHSICPYFAVFPPAFVDRYVLAYTEPNDVVFDPFSGRGTTVLQSLLLDRRAFGVDINPVAVCISGAKADPPLKESVTRRLKKLQQESTDLSNIALPKSPFFSYCYSPSTLKQLCLLRSQLNWKSSKVDRFIAALTLGCLHGESHKSLNCFSNRMPRAISTNPKYSMKWWEKNGYLPPDRDVFGILLSQVSFRYEEGVARLGGGVKMGDARKAGGMYRSLAGQVKLLLTSPPYLNTTDYGEDQWLRLWFLGGDDRPRARLFPDDRHESTSKYWSFLKETWRGQRELLDRNSTMVVRMGGKGLDVEGIGRELYGGVSEALSDCVVELAEDPMTSEIQRRQTNVFRPGTQGRREEHDFVFRILKVDGKIGPKRLARKKGSF